MTITHRTVLDEDGNPTAALIPWDQFQMIKAELEGSDDAVFSDELKAELDRRSKELDEGTVEAISHEEMTGRVRETLRSDSSSKETA